MNVEFCPLVASDVSGNFYRFLLGVESTGYPIRTSFAYSPLAIAWNDVLTPS